MDFACDDLLEADVKKGLPRWLPTPEVYHPSVITMNITQESLLGTPALSEVVVRHVAQAQEECNICHTAYEVEDSISRVEACLHYFYRECLNKAMTMA